MDRSPTRRALLLALAALAAPVLARAQSEQDRAKAAVESGEVKPLKSILKSVRRSYDGDVLDAELREIGGRWMYRVRVLTKDGQVVDVGVDGASGQIVGAE